MKDCLKKYQTNKLLSLVLNIDLDYCALLHPVVGIQKAEGCDVVNLETISHQFLLSLCLCENSIQNMSYLFFP